MHDAVVQIIDLALRIPYVKPIALLLTIASFVGWAMRQGAGEAAE